jgi:hypothetical protein
MNSTNYFSLLHLIFTSILQQLHELGLLLVMPARSIRTKQAMNEFTLSNIQPSFMKYTAQQIKRSLMKNDPAMLANLKVNATIVSIKYGRENH